MARKYYSHEFRRQAVDLYESTPGATLRSIAEDLEIVRGTLRQWLEVHGTGEKTARTKPLIPSPLKPTTPPRRAHRRTGLRRPSSASPGSRTRVVELEEITKLATEREILRQAAKHLAGETNC